jgi:hypothetical protein
MRILIYSVLAIPAQARTPDKVSPDTLGPEVAATRPWLRQVTCLYTNEKPLLGGGDGFTSREDCEVARRRLGSGVFGGTQRMSKKPIGIIVNCVFAPHLLREWRACLPTMLQCPIAAAHA